MRPILLYFLMMLPLWGQSQCLNLDLVILGDFSGSVSGHEKFVVDAIETFTASIQGGEGVRISVILFADQADYVCDLTNDSEKLFASMDAYRQTKARGGTNIGSALQTATNILLTEKNDSRKLVILISDGDATSGSSPAETISTAQQISSIGIGICSVLIKSASENPAFMKAVSGGGCYVESSYENLAAELENLNICF